MFYDRKEAGQLLAAALIKYRNLRPVVLAIPRGGVPIGYEVAKILKAPLDVAITKKIGHPENSEYAIGALGVKGCSQRDCPWNPRGLSFKRNSQG